MAEPNPSVVIVGGGFAGVGCAKALAEHDVDVTLIDRNNFHQFQPLLYQVATAQASPADVATPLRDLFRKHPRVTVKKATVTHVDPATRTVSTAEGAEFSGDYLVLAAGTGPNFFGVPGADEHALPLYALRDATRLRDRVFELFEEADTTPEVIEQGALTFVIVGGGPTGVETAGALIDLVDDVLAARFHDLDVATAARVVVVDHGEALLRPFSESAHEYVARVLEDRGVELWLGRGVAAVHADRVELADGTSIPTRCVVWAGGVSPTPLGLADELTTGRGPRLATAADLTLVGHPRVYAIGDVAQIADHDGTVLPQLGSVALQAGTHAG
ncbi:MAG: FAD-dependent oxidoreductase, partial [Acidimicrobiales bacterium]|nr:FAD-dependent oxidoreductase [Acidimicrobiales bacterium]